MAIDSYIHRIARGAPGKPILFAFHGTGGDENQFFDFARRMVPDATVVSPLGDVSEGGAARFFRRQGEGVYDMADLARATDRMADFIAAHREAARAGPVLGLGFSNGANILANLVIERGLFDVAALLHPLIPFQPENNPAIAGRSILITAGRQDPICPPLLSRALGDYFEAQGAKLCFEWTPGGHELCPREIEAMRVLFSPYR